MIESKTILVFSDDYENQQLFRACANNREYQIVFKEKKREVLRMLIAQKFDLIIDEIQKPLISEIDFFDSVYIFSNIRVNFRLFLTYPVKISIGPDND